jgi:hypothetical protein
VLDEAGEPVMRNGEIVMKSIMAEWAEKFLAEYNAESFVEGIVLVRGDTSTRWKRLFRDFLRCEYEGRMTFLAERDGEIVENDNCATFPVHLYYLGDRDAEFCRKFGELGDIYQRVEPEIFGVE